MNLIDAIKSGRPFTRKEWADDGMWLIVAPGTDGCEEVQFRVPDGRGHKAFVPFASDLTAEDYIVEEAPVTITQADFWLAVDSALKAEATYMAMGREPNLEGFAAHIGRKLGVCVTRFDK